MELFSICYISEKEKNLPRAVIDQISSYSMTENGTKQISGILIEYKSHFLQYLEGPTRKVYDLFERIKKDSRHKNVEIVQFKQIDERIFPGWNMVHKNLDLEGESSQMEVNKHCKNQLDDLLENKTFWKGIEIIEYLSDI
jgi:hypothetical protein